MKLPRKNHDPLVVVVTSDRYECYGDPTSRNAWLMALLKQQGGINETVEPGTYHFNARRRGLFKLVLSLDPAE